jgi:hypothetical protein
MSGSARLRDRTKRSCQDEDFDKDPEFDAGSGNFTRKRRHWGSATKCGAPESIFKFGRSPLLRLAINHDEARGAVGHCD